MKSATIIICEFKKNYIHVSFPFLCLRRYVHYDRGSIVIASAVRTPWVQNLKYHYPQISSDQLMTAVMEAAVKQSGVPVEKVEKVFVTQNGNDTEYCDKDPQLCKLLRKAKQIVVPEKKNGAMESLLRGIEELKMNKSNFVVISEVSFNPSKNEGKEMKKVPLPQPVDDYFLYCKNLYLKSFNDTAFDAELLPLKLIKEENKRRKQIELRQDEFPSDINTAMDGAAGLVLTSSENAKKYNVKPLAIIEDIAMEEQTNVKEGQQSLVNVMNEKFKQIPIDSIKQWQFNMDLRDIFSWQKQFQIPWEVINPFGFKAFSSPQQYDHLLGTLSHLSHSLTSNNYGCLVSIGKDNFGAIVIKKIPLTSRPLPLLTLYTTKSCSLCDILIEELESQFSGEYEMNKVYIDGKENVRYLRLYRHDIPVLYLNGQFLCMHRLNSRLLRRKLDQLKKIKEMELIKE